TYVMYPLHNCTKLVILAGLVPTTTASALREGLETIEPIQIRREIIDVSFDPTNWDNIELFKVISGLIDRGAELSKTRYPDRIYTDY
ncbi:hypothetical protein H0H93_004381, partial [Arthromyces matolae]